MRKIRADLAPLILTAQEKYQIPGLAIALVRSDEVLWLEGFGYANKTTGARVGPDTVFRVGSLTKPFTSLAVLKLADAGDLDVDQPLVGYLPELSIRSRFDVVAEPITVRSVLSHHAGLPTDLNKGMWTDQPFTELAAKLAEEYAAFPPFLVFSYSNVGYTLLGHMVEKLTGMSYPDYLQRNILAPVGMSNTRVSGRRPDGFPLASGYRGGRAFASLPIRDLPALGMESSASDLGRFMRTLLSAGELDGDRVFSPTAIEEMFEPQNPDVPLDLGLLCGLGWFLDEGSIPGAGRVVRHGGTMLAFASEMMLLPDQDLGVVVLANADGARAIVSRLSEEVLTRVVAGMATPPVPARSLADWDKHLQASVPGEIEGSYATDFGLIAIRPDNAEVCACVVQQTFDLIPYPNGWFGLGAGGVESAYPVFQALRKMRMQTRILDGREVIVAKQGERLAVLGEKVPKTPVPQVWLDRVGRYELLNPDAGFPLIDPQIKLRDGQLCMSYKMPVLSPKTIQVPLRPISDSEAIVLGLGRTRGETLRAVEVDGEELLRYSGFFGRKISASSGSR